MLRVLRAFAWLRWRVLLNSLERTGARDTLERLSIAVEQLGPIVAAVLFVPSALALAALAGYAGYALAGSATPMSVPFEVLRYLLLTAFALTIFGPLILPSSERTNAVRFLLLPISRATLYLAQALSAVTEPWILLVLPVVALVPAGLAIGGEPAAAGAALIAGLLLLAVLVGLSSLALAVLHLVYRNRRRGELLAVLFIVVLPVVAMTLGFAFDEDARGASAPPLETPAWLGAAAAGAFALLPSELYRQSVVSGVQAKWQSTALGVLTLLGIAGALHGLAFAAFVRMLGSPASAGSTSASAAGARWRFMIPGLSPGASAVALNQVRLAVRTPRGRSILLTTVVPFAVFAVLVRRAGSAMELGFFDLQTGIGLAAFGAGVCLLAILPFAMNQFAIDRAGLTLQFLSPLTDLDILVGKAVGNGLLTVLPASVCVGLAFAIFPGGPAGLWLSIPLGITATYVLAVPVAAALSAVFPRAVDLNSIGSRSNAHGLAGLLGVLTFAAAAVPSAALALAAVLVLDRPAVAPLLLGAWLALALAICRLLLSPVARLLHERRENLALVA